MSIAGESYRPFDDFSAWNMKPSIDEIGLLDRHKRLRSHSITKFNAAVVYVTKAAALDTGAIEQLYETDRGFTYAVAAQANAIDFVQNRKGDNFATHFSDQLKAYEYVLDHATGDKPLSQTAIRELHAVICAHQETYRVWTDAGWDERELKKGAYKDQPNTVTKANGSRHHYCPPNEVSLEIQRLVDQTSTVDFTAASAIVKAAYVHHVLTVVHPFSDGNGRVSRALASIYLISDYKIPLLIHADQRDFYFDALEMADSGNTQEICYFIYDRVWEALELIEENINRTNGNDKNEIVSRVIKKYAAESETYDSRIDAIARNLLRISIDTLNRELQELAARIGDYIAVSSGTLSSQGHQAELRPGYRHVFGDSAKLISTVKSKNPGDMDLVQFVFDFLVPTGAAQDESIYLVQVSPAPSKSAYYARLSECEDDIKRSLQYRIDSWARKVASEMISELAQQ